LSTTPPSSPPTPSSDPYLGATLTTYDSLGRAIQVTSPTGGITLTTYDTDGNVTETQVESNNSTDAPTIATTTAYDSDDQPVEITTGSSTTLSYYDPDGNVYCSVSANAYAEGTSDYQCPPWESSWIATPPSPLTFYSTAPTAGQANNVTTNFYDPDQNLLQSTNPDVDTSVSQFDPDGRVYCSATPTNVANYLSAHSSAPWPYVCPTPPLTSPPTGTTHQGTS
jgi:YD repeat-containing protein